MIRPLFQKYQKELLAFANTEFGREFIADKWGGKIERGERVVGVTPDGFHVLKDIKDGKAVVQATFFPRSPYVKKFALALEALRIADEAGVGVRDRFTRPEYFINHPYVYFATGTFNPDANPESTTVDGYTYYNASSGATWADLRGFGTGTNVGDTESTSDNVLITGAYTDTNKWQYIGRSHFLFDSSSLPNDATKDSAVFSIHGNTPSSTSLNISYGLVASTCSSNTSLATSDYSQRGSTEFSSNNPAIADFDNNAYVDINLNSSGLTAVSLTGITKLALISKPDIDGDTGPTWSSGVQSYATMTMADSGSNKPKLVVTYNTALESSGGLIFISS